MKINPKQALISWLYIAVLFPFVSPFPIGTDVQPIALLISTMLLLNLIFFEKYPFKIYNAVIFLFYIFFCFFYIFPNANVNIIFSKSLALFFAPILFFILLKYESYFSFSILKYSILVYFSFSILMQLSPDLTFLIQGYIVRHINSIELGYRGISTFSTEPGLFAGLVVCFIYFLIHFYRRGDISKRGLLIYLNLCVLMIFLSKSGTGIMYLTVAVIFLGGYFFYNKYGLPISTILVAMTIVFISLVPFNLLLSGFLDGSSGRGLQVISISILDPFKLLGDSSIFYRIYALEVSFWSLLEHPFGVGIGDVTSTSNQLIQQSERLSEFYSQSKFGFRSVSSVGYYIQCYGFIFLLPFIFLIYFSKTFAYNKLLVIMLLSFSYSFIFSPAWLLLALNGRKK